MAQTGDNNKLALLLGRAQSGNMGAQDEFFRRARPQIFEYFRKTFPELTVDAIEDLTQDTIVRAFRASGRFEFRGNGDPGVFAWLYRIATNVGINRYRRAQRTPEMAPMDEHMDRVTGQADPAPTPDKILEDRQLPEDLRDTLAALPDAFRQAVVLVDLHGLTYEKAAQLLRVPVGTVRSRLSRGRNLLRDSLPHRNPERHKPLPPHETPKQPRRSHGR
ncbi:MAG: sigma-70 family RNA polymerase sigma factor [Candidatus Diapherotrites archaeon]|nr:sigma-70 family RNA polymerase sigma factor [Candidatus Diapherotrites archaeon]